MGNTELQYTFPCCCETQYFRKFPLVSQAQKHCLRFPCLNDTQYFPLVFFIVMVVNHPKKLGCCQLSSFGDLLDKMANKNHECY